VGFQRLVNSADCYDYLSVLGSMHSLSSRRVLLAQQTDVEDTLALSLVNLDVVVFKKVVKLKNCD
jgi:hypothetical protein